MIQELCDAWGTNKELLAEHYRKQLKEDVNEFGSTFTLDYETIVKNLITVVINPFFDTVTWIYPLCEGFNANNLVCLDHGDYQGTMVFIVPLDVYQPAVTNYLYTSVSYGSCSACDTLQQVLTNVEDDGSMDEVVIKDLLTLSLHLLQKAKWLTEDINEHTENR